MSDQPAGLKLVDRSCPLCGSQGSGRVVVKQKIEAAALGEFAFASRKLPDLMHYSMVSCKKCTMVYATPAPQADELNGLYREAAFASSEEARLAAATYARLIAKLIPELPDTRGALDIGTGEGSFLEELQALGFSDIAGVEPSRAPIDAAKPHIKALIRDGSFFDAAFSAESFSLVTCFQTIEHLHDPLEAGKRIFSLLKRGGAAVIVCHNVEALSAKMLGQKSPIFDVEHLQLFSPRTARRLLRECGFQKVRVHNVINSYPLRYWASLSPLPPNLKTTLSSALDAIRLAGFKLALPAGNLAVIGFKPKPDQPPPT